MPKAFTISDLDRDIANHNRGLKRYHTSLILDRQRKKLRLRARYDHGQKTKTRSIALGFSARETGYIAQAFVDGFKFSKSK